MGFNIKDSVNSAVNFYKQHEPTVDKLKEAGKYVGDAVRDVSDAFDSAAHGAAHGINHDWSEELAKGVEGKLGVMNKLGIASRGVGAVVGIATLPGQAVTAYKEVREAMRTGSRDDIVKAAQSTGEAATNLLETSEKAVRTATTINRMGSSYKAALTAFRAAAPTASEAVAKATARSAMKSVVEGASRQVGRAAARTAAETAAKATAGTLAHAVAESGSRAAAKAVLRDGAHAAAEAAVHAGERAAVGTLGKAAARFAPGLNVAMAVVDTGVAVATLADKNASTGKKVTACITALGSIASATNIPVVSQIGAAVSTVSSIVSAFF